MATVDDCMRTGMGPEPGRKRGAQPKAARRRGFTILETVIAIALASLVIIVIFNTLLTSRMQVEKNMETLEFLSKATVLLEYVKRDIRNASRRDDSVICAENLLTIITMGEGGTDPTVEYKFRPDLRIVRRLVRKGGSDGGEDTTWFGRAGKTGIITEFNVTPVDDANYAGFYRVVVAFMSRGDMERQKQHGNTDPKPKRVHTFRALVNRRTPAAVDDRWNAGFRGPTE